MALVALAAWAHPPLSIVVDEQGRVFYSDLRKVWVQEKDGSRRVAVPDVHNHELRLSEDGSVLGEDVANVGERYRRRVWRRSPEGTVSNARPWREGHPSDHGDISSSMDSKGRTYVLRHAERRLDILAEDGTRHSVPIDPELGYLHAVAVSPDGGAFVTAGRTLLRLREGEDAFEAVARDLGRRTRAFEFVHERHALLGLWLGREGRVLVADYAGQQVIQVSASGAVTSIHESQGKWSPCAGTIGKDGSHWILEWSTDNEARLQRIGDSTPWSRQGAMMPYHGAL
jgi:sugar lactone lactonase YvrE